ncbi:MAG: pyridoxal phosphate-dependent aminotransferase, partial [Gemmataceae bacterium]
MPELSTRRMGTVPRTRPSATLAIHEQVAALRRAGRNIFHLGFGESRFPVHPRLQQALADHADRAGYLPILGLPELREAVAAFSFREHNRVCHPDQVVIGPGSKMLMYAALLALKGDLLLPAPSWVSYEPQAHLVQKEVHWLPTNERDGYTLQPGILASAVQRLRKEGHHPRILLLNSPSNPTGVGYPAALLAELSAVARREHLVILSDEIYALTQHDGQTPVSIASFFPEGTIVSTGLSKHLSLGGWRLGAMELPAGRLGAGLRTRLEAIASETWSAVVAPIQYAALTAYSDDPELREYRQWCARAHGVLVHFLRQKLLDCGLVCPRPNAAFYLFPSFEPFRDN